MKAITPIITVILAWMLFPSSCHANQHATPMNNTIQLIIGSSAFTVRLAENETAAAFKALLPLKITMKEINGNEKYYNMPKNLPSSSSVSGTVQPGDLMLWGSDCLVIFYEKASTSYSYTRIGRITNVSGLSDALGNGNAAVSFEQRK